MKIKGIIKDIQIGTDLKPEIVIGTGRIGQNIEELKNKKLVITLEEEKDKRSLNANSYYWSLLSLLKDILGLPLQQLHLRMLEDYGKGTYIKIDKQAKEYFERSVKYFKKLEETEYATEYLVLLGSSEMNTKEFSNLLNGVIQECEQQGIRTLEVEEIEKMVEEWGKVK